MNVELQCRGLTALQPPVSRKSKTILFLTAPAQDGHASPVQPKRVQRAEDQQCATNSVFASQVRSEILYREQAGCRIMANRKLTVEIRRLHSLTLEMGF